MKGIKKILSLGLLLVFSFSMVSCGGSKENILEGTVVVTSKYPDEVNSYIAEEFKKETGISVKYEVKDEIKEDDFTVQSRLRTTTFKAKPEENTVATGSVH